MSIALCEDFPVYLISLSSAVDRRQELLSKGIPGSWVDDFSPACDFRSLKEEVVEQYVSDAFLSHYKFMPSRGQVGCDRSHYQACTWLASSDYPFMLVLEDDVVPCTHEWMSALKDTKRDVGTFFGDADAAWVLHLGVAPHWRDKILKRKVLVGGISEASFLMHIDPTIGLWETHAYLISREAARRIVLHEKSIKTMVDDWLRRKQVGLFDYLFFSNSQIFTQNDSLQSDIAKERKTKSLVHPVKRKFTLSRMITSINARSLRLHQVLLSKIPYIKF